MPSLENILMKILDEQSLNKAEAEMAFRCFDGNNNGFISKSELEAAINKLVGRKQRAVGAAAWMFVPQPVIDGKKAKARRDFSNADTNGDGQIDFDEFWAVCG